MSINNILNKYSANELADALIFKHNLTEEQKLLADKDLMNSRNNKNTLTAQQVLYARLLQLRFQIEDSLKTEEYNENMSFAFFLNRYIKLIYKTNKDFAKDLNLKETALSLYLNKHRFPNDETIMRIDIHSGNNIPTLLWHKLVEKEKQHALQMDQKFRMEQSKFVKNKLDLILSSK